MGKKVLMILDSDFLFPFIDNRVKKEAKSLMKEGHDVFVLCKRRSDKGDAVGTFEGIRYSRISDIGLFGLWKWYFSVFKEAIKPEWGVVHTHNTHSSVLAIPIKVFGRKRIVHDSHELAVGRYSPKIKKILAFFIEFFSLFAVDGVIVVNKEILKVMERIYPYLRYKRTAIIGNLEEIEEVSNVKEDKKLKERIGKEQTVFVYEGAILKDRGISNVIEVFKECGDKASLVVMGGDEEYTFGNNIFVFKYMPRERMLGILKSCDVGIVSLLNVCKNNYYATPNKLSEYMACSCAVLVPDFPHLKELEKENQIGASCDFSSKESIKKAVEKLCNEDLKDKKERAKRLYDESFNWEMGSELPLIELYKKVTNEH